MTAREEDRRSEARERALLLLYEAEAKGGTPREVVENLPVAPDPMATQLVEGVQDRREEIDDLLATHARGWTLQRMPVIDRTVLEIATYELLARPEVPTAVVIDEAVELAKRFSTDDSGRFVNGMLATIASKVRSPAN